MARRLRASAPTTTTPAPAPVEPRQANPEAWRIAATLLRKDAAGADLRRLVPLSDGSVLIRNQPRT